MTTADFTLQDMEDLYSEMQLSLLNIGLEDDNRGCEEAIIKGHELSYKLMMIIKEMRRAN